MLTRLKCAECRKGRRVHRLTAKHLPKAGWWHEDGGAYWKCPDAETHEANYQKESRDGD
jgi:hypothetical protein